MDWRKEDEQERMEERMGRRRSSAGLTTAEPVRIQAGWEEDWWEEV